MEGRPTDRRRIRLAILAGAVAAVTVLVPPLITPDRPTSAPPPAAPAPPPSAVTPSATPPADTSSGSRAPSRTPPPAAVVPAGSTSPAPPACAPAGTASSRPSCAVYTSALGTGWMIEPTGVRVLPAGVVPGTDQVAIRVEPQQPVAAVALVAATPVRAPGRLRFRVYGGRVHGTVLRLSLSATAQPDPRQPVVLTAPVDRWSEFTVALAELVPAGRPVRRIDLVIATDMVPNAYRFFVDDVEFVD